MSSEISNPNYRPDQSVSTSLKNPLILVMFVSAVLITGIVAIAFGHKFGYNQGYKSSQQAIKHNSTNIEFSSEEVDSLKSEVESLRKNIDSLEQERDISLNNLEQLRSKVDDLELSNLQLEQVITVFSNEISQKGGLDLKVVGAKIAPLPENAFEYRFDIAMLARDNDEHRLTPKLTLLDEDNLVEVPIEPKYYDIKGISRIRGRFIMPTGFKPKQAKLELSANGQDVEQIYDWELDKPVEKLPISLADIPETDKRPVTMDESDN